MKSCAGGQRRAWHSLPPIPLLLLSLALRLLPRAAAAGGVVTNCTEADLRRAMADGGTVTFACDGTIYLSATITNLVDVSLDGSGHQICLSGNQAVRLFYVATNVSLSLVNLTLADGFSSAGSAVANLGGRVSLNGVTLRTNVASMVVPWDQVASRWAVGGAIFNRGGTVGATSCTFIGNLARAYWGTAPNVPPALGGALRNESGQMTLELCTFTANRAESSSVPLGTLGPGQGADALGGALYNSGTLAVEFCTFHQNSAIGGSSSGSLGGTSGGNGYGGALWNAGLISVQGSTFSSNNVAGGGGANGANGTSVFDLGTDGTSGASGGAGGGGAVCNRGTASVVNCTFAGNTGQGGAGGNGGNGGGGKYGGKGGNGGSGGSGGGGIDGTCALTNCTLAWNTGTRGAGGAGGAGGSGVYPGSSGASGLSGLAWGGANFVEAVNTLVASNNPSGNETFPNPKLGSLAGNGGPTQTIALLPGSPAIDAADKACAPWMDQRGFPRPAGATADLGAYEYGSVVPTLNISRSGTALSIIGSGNAGQVCRLLAATNQVSWVPVDTNRFDSTGTVTFSVTNSSSTWHFYRLVMP